jgi:S1-C subfamily serine protease
VTPAAPAAPEKSGGFLSGLFGGGKKTETSTSAPAPAPETAAPAAVTPPPPPPQQVVARAAPPAVQAAASTVGMPEPKRPAQPIAENPAQQSQLLSALVAVKSSGPPGVGVVVDKNGSVLTNWSVLGGADSATLQFISVAGAAAREFKARAVAVDKATDLALLRMDAAPEGLMPATLAAAGEAQAGQALRVAGLEQGRPWISHQGVITRVSPNFTWFSDQNAIHRGEIIAVDVPPDGRGLGRVMVNSQYQVLGLHAFTGKESGKVYAISARSLHAFLGASAAAP